MTTKKTPTPAPKPTPKVISTPPDVIVPEFVPEPEPTPQPTAPPAVLDVLRELLDAAPRDVSTCHEMNPAKLVRYLNARQAAAAVLG